MRLPWKNRIVVTYVASTTVLVAVMIASFLAFCAVHIYQGQKFRLTSLSEAVHNNAATMDAAVFAGQMNAGKAIFDARERLAVDVVDNQGAAVYRSPKWPQNAPGAASVDREFAWHAISLHEWFFVYRYDGPQFRVTVCAREKSSTFDDLLTGFYIFLPLSLVCAFIIALPLSNWINRPYQAIGETAAAIRSGDLTSRISSSPESSPEINQLIVSLNATFAELERSFEATAQFSADAAHELRTPLTVLRTKLEVFGRRERSREETDIMVADCVAEISHLTRTVNTLLQISEPGSRDKIAFEAIDMSALLDSVVTRNQEQLVESAVALDCRIEAGLSVSGNADFLDSLFQNLIDNGIKFNSAKGTVNVTARRDAKAVVVDVIDTGVGMSVEEAGQAFQRFYRARNGKTGGAGLGLALVKWIVDLHDASLKVDSVPGRGTTITVSFAVSD
jgi:signal transduction histidine kinase